MRFPRLVSPFLLLVVLSAAATPAATLSGRATSTDGRPEPDTRIVLVELNRGTFVDGEGRYTFDHVPPGSYHVQAIHPRLGTHVLEVTLGEEPATLDFVLARGHHHEQIVVSAGVGRGSAEVYRPVHVLDRDELAADLEPTLGETLRKQPGVSSTHFGAGASRPVIRGQGGGRIRVLESGLDSGDASVTSPDHAVAIDPIGAERIEIVRGPSTLLYGSTAVGGVVNVLDNRIPDHVPQHPLGGTIDLRLGTVADERSGATRFQGGDGSFAWTLGAFSREADDYEIPGHAVLGDPTSPSGVLPNSGLESRGLDVGGSWIRDTGHVGFSVRRLDSLYGIPAEIEGDKTIGADGVAIDLEHVRYDVRGGYALSAGPFDSVDFAAGGTDYEHKELEAGAVGTRFLNDTLEGRVELRHGLQRPVDGVLGLQFNTRDFEAIGAEAFLPPSRTDNLALFVVEEWSRGPMRYDVGLRFERQEISVDAASGLPDREFDGMSGSLGAAWVGDEAWSVGATVTRAVRFPIAEELYSDGPHLATFSYELGDVNLREEDSVGVDLTVRRRTGRVQGELNLFYSRYADYIYEAPTGAFDDGLPVFRFSQDDAAYRGAELGLDVELAEVGEGHVGLRIVADTVRAELTELDENLPRIPPSRLGAHLHYHGEAWQASVGFDRYADQDRIAPFETPTDGYTLVDARVSYRVARSGVIHEIQLIGNNLTDEEARPHTSRLKDLAPLPGRNVSLAYRLIF